MVDRSLERATQRSLERAHSLIEAALQLLREGDSEGFTVQEVADRAGQSLRTFYQHFGTKNDLLLAVFEEKVSRSAAGLEAAVEPYDDPMDRLAAYLVATVSRRGEAQEEVALSQYHNELAASRPEDLATVQRPIVDLVCRLVQDAMDAGAIPEGDVEAAAYMMVALKTARMHSAILGNELGLSLPDPQSFARFCIEGLGGKLPSSLRDPEAAALSAVPSG